AAGIAVSLGAKIPELAKLRALSDSEALDAPAAQKVFDFVESKLSLGTVQAARAATLGWSADERADAPAFTGKLEMQGERVVLTSGGATYQVVNTGNQCWGTDATAFYGQIVTVKGWPDGQGRLLAEEFAPG